MKKKTDFDIELQKRFDGIEIDARGIDWDSFEDHKKKKRRAIFFRLSIFAGICILLLTPFLFPFLEKNKLSNKENSQAYISNPLEKATVDNRSLKSENSGSNNPDPQVKMEEPSEEPQSALSTIIKPNTSHFKKIKKSEPIEFSVTPSISEPSNASPRNIHQYVLNEENVENFTGLSLSPVSEFKRPFDPTLDSIKLLHKISAKWNPFIGIGVGLSFPNPGIKLSELGKSFVHRDYEKIRQSAETVKSGWNFGLLLGLSKKRTEMSIGIAISNLNMNGQYQFTYSDRPVIDLDGSIAGYNAGTPIPIQFTSILTYRFIEIPFEFNYYPVMSKSGRNALGIHSAFHPIFLNKIKGEMPDSRFMDQRENLNPSNFKSSSLAGELGLSIRSKRTESLSLKIDMYYRVQTPFKQALDYYQMNMNRWGIRTRLQFGL